VRGVTYEKTHACKETFKVTMRASRHGGQCGGGDRSDRCTPGPSKDDQIESFRDRKLKA
jgi:hypothetical protein